MQFIALLNRFDRTQGLVWGAKIGFCHLKFRLNPAAWVLLGEINVMGNCAGCNEGLATLLSMVGVGLYISLSCVALIAHKAPFGEEKSGFVT